MSASREKKARQELNESGYVDPRKAREAEEKAKERRSTRIYTAVIVAFVLLGVVLFASGRIQASNEAKETARIGAESAVTIDGEDARDFDDAVYVRRLPGAPDGAVWELWVAIADVSHFVLPGSRLDREARDRGNSYYFPTSVEPMLPEVLSNGLCSLRPDEDRLVMAARIGFDDRGIPRTSAFFPGVIRSRGRLTYEGVQEALDKARAEEPWPLAKNTLDLLWSNLAAAREEALPICQDTGMACVFVELGTEVHIEGSFEAAIHEGVRRGYTDGYLRKSIVADPLRRGNTGDNTPAAITVHLVDGDGCTITVAPKGFGSENMSRIRMLKPADGVEGFKKFVVETVRLAGSNPCPPIVLGIGVGGSFDKVAYLAKKALLRPLDVPNPDPYYAALEGELLTAINALGIGPQGFGGKTTCLGLAIEQMPTHVAGLPVAVNVSCHVTRRASAVL